MNDAAKVLLGVLGGLTLLLVVFPTLASLVMGGGMMGGMGQMMGGGMFGSGFIGLLFMVLFWGLVIALIAAFVVWIVKQLQR